jgi:hypothetical protein
MEAIILRTEGLASQSVSLKFRFPSCVLTSFWSLGLVRGFSRPGQSTISVEGSTLDFMKISIDCQRLRMSLHLIDMQQEQS